ncbi:MAG: hypothetical protein UX76_C0011G0043 [Candidatus Wolfebacteria bacterium GW2011_GWC1_47_103]|nr:MAG: hypothetical protein UX76_C0011G0043 [Candidatus Wolfebacteria bacterium GW2011_GWC1_47_103]
MKRIVSLAVAIIVLVASVPVYAVTLATESGFYVGMKRTRRFPAWGSS